MPNSKIQNSITRQLQFVFAVSIFILLVSSGASFYSNQRLIDTSKWVNHTNQVISEGNHLGNIVKTAENNQRGYLISNNAAFLTGYNGSYQKALISYEKLRELTRDNALQQNNLKKIKVIIDERFRQFDKLLQISTDKSPANRAIIFTDNAEVARGKAIMDDFINLLQQIQNEEKRLLQLREDEQKTFIVFTPILVLVAAILSILISIMAYLRIKADLDARYRKQLEDEAQYKETVARITTMQGVTKQLADGNFAARSHDKKDDELGLISRALNDMAAALQANFNELEARNWLQAGSVEISKAMRGERYVKNIAAKVVASIASHLSTPLGTVYVVDNDMNLKYAGGYGVANVPEEIKIGEGLIGQAIADKKMVVLENVPDNYIRVSSSVGSVKPAQLIILPLVYGPDAIGVIEIGMLRSATELELQYLNNNAEAIAIAMNGAINYDRMLNLLEETQAQAEELQAQHNELESINTELEAQSEKLQASEEELKVQQEELQEANVELEERSRLLEESYQRIAEQNVEVKRKADELELTTRYKSEFLANMSHELRTPLNSILLLGRLLAENSEHNLNTDQVEYAKVILSSGNGLLTLIDEILDLSKIEAGKMSLEFDKVSIDEVENDMKALFEPVAKDKGLSFVFTQEENIPKIIETDKLRLEQVIKNLVSNALKFTTEGGIFINVYNNPVHENAICLSVRDTGIGIPQEKQKMIFEAFQQADGSTRRKYGGTGLGLSISKELIKLLGGNIELKSKPGEGSTFTICLPVKRQMVQQGGLPEILPEMNEITAEAEYVTPQYISDTIPENIPDDRNNIQEKDNVVLIVEDDVNFARSLLDYSRSRNYKGIVAVRGDEGVELARQYLPAGILLDIQLPVMSGWDVMEMLKKDPATRHIPVHVMSSYEVKRESLVKGAVDFINKPFAFEKMQEVFKKLEHVLNNESKHVLIVEENPKHAKALAYFLETCNINSEIKHDVVEGVEALKNNVQCVILDMGIPDQKAYDTLEELKKDANLENLPIIIFTGKSLSFSEEQRIKQYADSVVLKTAHSYQRILDEVSIFLHLMQESKAKVAQKSYKKLGALNDVLVNKTVLVVDDDVRNIFSLTKALEKLNMQVVTAVDGKEALAKLQEHSNIDLVLLDMMMPEMDGYETATAIRQNKMWKDLPVIAVTAKAMVGDREKCIQAGASDYISKPVDIDQLLSLLRVWLYERV
ncbi:MAG: response regulator [Bacteroidetes bacterium]|nr:response regulator [Bacteroidota bacterium]